MTIPTTPQPERTPAAAGAIPTAAQSVPYATHQEVVFGLGGKGAEAFQTAVDVAAVDEAQEIALPFDPAYVMFFNPSSGAKLETFAAMDASILEATGEGFARSLLWNVVTLGSKKVTVDFSGGEIGDEGDTVLVVAHGYPANGGVRMAVPD